MDLRRDAIFVVFAVLFAVGVVWRFCDVAKYGMVGHGGRLGFLYFGLFSVACVALLWRFW